MNSIIPDSPPPLADILPKLTQNGFIAFCGAGISIPAPTCAPSWWVLTEEILYGFYDRIPKEWGLPNDLIVKDDSMQPEEVFELFASVFDERLYEVFKALDTGRPNATHQLIARLAKEGSLKACFTTNFDVYVERALKEEGVEFDLIVENPEFTGCISRLRAEGIGNKFILCKIHGTIERPQTIVSVASAYKSTKGFSSPKAEVFNWLLEQYPCLFLGYSGWDFEHINYVRFWEKVGRNLKGIYWNRRPGETGSPNFSTIFQNCKDRVTFCQADLPEGLLAALKHDLTPHVSLEGLNLVDLDESDKSWQQTKKDREAFFQQWASTLPEGHSLAAAMSQGELLSAKSKAKFQKMVEQTKSSTSYTGPDPALLKEQQELGTKLSSGEISFDDFNKRNFEIQLEMQLGPVKEEFKSKIKTIFNENAFPGYTDDANLKIRILSQLVEMSNRMDPSKAAVIIIDCMKKEKDAMKEGQPYYTAEFLFNTIYINIVSENESAWKPIYEKMLVEKKRFIGGEIDQNQYQLALKKLVTEPVDEKMGLSVPVAELMQRLMKVVVDSKDVEEYKLNCEAFFIAAQFRYAFINALLFNSPEYKAIINICHQKPAATQSPAPTMSPETQQELVKLAQKYAAQEISLEEYQELVKEITAKSTIQPAEPQQAAVVSTQGGQPVVSTEILDKYDARIREYFKPVLETQRKFFGDELNHEKMLVEMCVFSIWIAGTQYLDIDSGTKVQEKQMQGLYPKVTSNPSVAEYIWNKNEYWIEKALRELPARFCQKLLFYLVTLSEETDNMALCERVTLRSLEFTDGIVNETVLHNIPICLAAFYHEKGDKETALKYYMIGLDAVTIYVPSVWSDVNIYQSASLLAEKGQKEEALKVIGKYHSDFRGNLPPYCPPAREMAKQLAEKLASDLGFPDAKTAMFKLLG